MGVDDPQQFHEGLKKARERLADSDTVHPADRQAITQWIRQRDGSVTISTLKTYLRRTRVASERSDTPLVEMDAEAFYDLVFRLRHDHDLSDATIHSYEAAVLKFLDDTTDADWVDDVDRTTVDSGGPKVDEMLEPADIQQLTRTARHQRDVAFIDFLADTGVRLSMALSLRVRDVDLGDPPTYSPNSNAEGLKGAPDGEYPLIDSAASLRSYLRTAHPRPDEPGAALFHKLKPHSRDGEERWSGDGAIRANAIRQQLGRIADRADLDKPVNPHAFRHAAITRMVREGYSRSQIEHRVHWSLDTDMWEIYEHITGEEHTQDIFREAGVVDDDDGPDTVRKPCGNCREPLAPHHEFCPNCGQPATPGAEDEVDDAKDGVLEDLVEATSPSVRRELRTLLDGLEEHPDAAHDDSP